MFRARSSFSYLDRFKIGSRSFTYLDRSIRHSSRVHHLQQHVIPYPTTNSDLGSLLVGFDLGFSDPDFSIMVHRFLDPSP